MWSCKTRPYGSHVAFRFQLKRRAPHFANVAKGPRVVSLSRAENAASSSSAGLGGPLNLVWVRMATRTNS